MSFAKLQTEDRRLCLLLALHEATGYKSNHMLLCSFLDSVGHTVSHDQTKTDLQWLQDQGLLTSTVHDNFIIPTITQRGQDVATGHAKVPGVKRPSPGVDA